VTRKLFVVVAVLAFTGLSALGQSKPSIQGVWRAVEVTVTNPNPAAGLLGKGTHTSVQPSLLIFTNKHYSTTADQAAKPRPTTQFKVLTKPTAEEMQAQWGPFAANAGTYELSGNALTRRPMVAKNPLVQGSKGVTRSTIKMDQNTLWITTAENAGTGKIQYPSTIKYTRVE
jgi:hypothetical protein